MSTLAFWFGLVWTVVSALVPSGCADMVLALAAQRFTVVEHATVSRTLRFAGTGPYVLEVRTFHGTIHVDGYDGTSVQLDAAVTYEAETAAALREAREDARLDVSDEAATVGLVVRSGGFTCGEPSRGRRDVDARERSRVTADVVVRVPRGTALRLCTVNGENIRVQGTAGTFEVQNVNGPVTMTGITGAGEARTVNGPLSIAFAAAPTGPSAFTTVNGDVDLTLPASTAADLHLTTFSGDVFTDFDTTVLPTASAASDRRRNGTFSYRSDRRTSVRIGGGGPALTADTLNGDVRVHRAAR
ncbi:MAG: DUF4097 family beta strand repeat protein [Acidobacteria bacterium]|nr:DUF4097 family beta strand repeat protein [Acidobacteriota bacterium]